MDWKDFLSETETRISVLSKEVPETARGFAMMSRAAKTDGALDERTKEFMALGIAISTRCDSCIGFHVRALVRLGATRPEICEALAMVTYMGGGPSYSFSAKALQAYDQFTAAQEEGS